VAAKQLWSDISEGRHPLTHEGIVVHPRLGKPWKGKLTEENDVHVTGVYPGEGKYAGHAAGGFEYALQPGGPTVGRVGSGLSDDLRGDLLRQSGDYLGRVARIRAQEQLPSGAYRAPSFLAFHEDYPTTQDKLACDLTHLEELGISKKAADEETPPTLAVDLDGTLAEQEEPFDPEHIGKPRRGIKKWMKLIRDTGARIIIWTVRGDKELVSTWLDKHAIPYDYINENPDQPEDGSGKIIADVYFDDRAVSAKSLAKGGPEVVSRLKAADDTFLPTFDDPQRVVEFLLLMNDGLA
jgi:hypothetical protein